MIDTISLLSSSAVPVGVDDRLRLIFRNITSNAITGYLRYLFENEDGSLGYTTEEITIPASPGTTTSYFPLFPGRILYVSISAGSSTIPYGQLWAEISIIHGSVNYLGQVLFLTSGHIETESFLAYPYNRPEAPSAIQPTPFTPSISDPAPGSGFNWDPSSISTANLIAGAFTFTADANVANRTIQLTVNSAGGSISVTNTGTNIVAGETRRIILWSGANRPADNSVNHYLQFPANITGTQLSFEFTAANIQAGDTFTAINLLSTMITNPT